MNRPALIALALACACTTATAADPPTPQAAVDEAPEPKMAPLLALALRQVATMAATELVGDAARGLFRRLLGMHPEVQRRGSATGAVAPVVGYTVQQLDPASFHTVKTLPVAGGPPVLRTGDVFALLYSTNLPGQVRLENIDPTGKVADLGVYTVLPDQLNRLPRDLGIKLVGQPGAEIIRFYFYPCLPPGADGAAWAASFAGKLPECGRGPNPVMQAAASGAVQPKALVNLAQPDETMSFAGAADYRLNDITSTVAVIRHEAR